MLQVLMLGTMVPKATNEFCFKKKVKTSAADIAQQYVLHGLEDNDAVESIDTIGAVRIKPWPKAHILRVQSDIESKDKGEMRGVAYLNIPLFGFVLRERALVSAVKAWAYKHRNKDNIVVFVYSMHSPFMRAAKVIKQIIPSARIALIVADLPLLMDMRGILRKGLKRVDWLRINLYMKYVDKYLLYTKHMAEYLHLSKDKWTLFEGLIDEKRIVTEKQKKSEQLTCLYAGNLDARYGIDLLIEAFSKIKTKAKLYIYGEGFDSQRIASLAADKERIEYFGQVTPDEVFDVMKKSTLLINPRPSTIGLSKYSCPSKTFEYIASGTPVLMNPLQGMPDEYLPYVYLFRSETVDGYASSIDSILSKSTLELEEFGFKASQFLKTTKSSRTVIQKALNFIMG